ncbi:MAG TPA: hypothetical protein PLL57_11680 [Flavobacteriales bacterium]|nr:hypothetical protein [Flavobacteriales bacterium]
MLRSLTLTALSLSIAVELAAQAPTLVRDFYPGQVTSTLLNHGRPNTFLIHNDRLHLFANDGVGLPKLFALDDLSGNVTELAQVGAPMISVNRTSFVASGDNLYFITQEGFNYVLYVVNDGGATALHTAPIQILFNYTLIPMPDGGVIFPGYDAMAGYEPWYTDGTTGGTHLLKDIMPGTATGMGDPFPLFQGFDFDGRAWFLATDGTNGVQLWVSDGTEQGTDEFVSINDPDDSGAISLAWSRNQTRFIVRGNEGMLSSDGSLAGTSVLHPYFYATPHAPGLNYPDSDDGVMYFSASENGTWKLFTTDGVTNTVVLSGNVPGQGLPYLTKMGDLLYTFVLDDDDYVSLARIDPSTQSLTVLTNFAEFGGSFPGLYNAYGFRTDGAHVYFMGNLSEQGRQYWMSDGTAEGTRMVYNFMPTVGNGGPDAASANMIVFQDQFVYTANDPGVGVELFAGSGVVGIEEQPDAVALEAWAAGPGVLALQVEDDELRHVRILDIAGRTVLEQGLRVGAMTTVSHQLQAGIYAVVVNTREGQAVRKVFLR